MDLRLSMSLLKNDSLLRFYEGVKGLLKQEVPAAVGHIHSILSCEGHALDVSVKYAKGFV